MKPRLELLFSVITRLDSDKTGRVRCSCESVRELHVLHRAGIYR
ncbi:MAG: hypothetical protein AAGI88_09325 [Pseudomonadota bacterium]